MKHSERKPSPSQMNLVSIVSTDRGIRLTESDLHCFDCVDRWLKRFYTKRRR